MFEAFSRDEVAQLTNKQIRQIWIANGGPESTMFELLEYREMARKSAPVIRWAAKWVSPSDAKKHPTKVLFWDVEGWGDTYPTYDEAVKAAVVPPWADDSYILVATVFNFAFHRSAEFNIRSGFYQTNERGDIVLQSGTWGCPTLGNLR